MQECRGELAQYVTPSSLLAATAGSQSAGTATTPRLHVCRACLCSWCKSRELVLKAYFIFSIGNIRPLLVAEYTECWRSYTECTKTLTEAPDYTQIIGKFSTPAHLLAALER